MPPINSDLSINIVEPSYEILTPIDYSEILKSIELIGRNAYKSEKSITDSSAEDFIKRIIKRGHESVIEHRYISVRFICDRGISHEIVRHRIASYTQESTRFCNYSKNKFNRTITFIMPYFWRPKENIIDEQYAIWYNTCQQSALAYFSLIDSGATAEQARSVLPTSLKTDIIATMNLREWRHFFRLRTHSSAHPQMLQLSIPLLKEFKEKLPAFFEDI